VIIYFGRVLLYLLQAADPVGFDFFLQTICTFVASFLVAPQGILLFAEEVRGRAPCRAAAERRVFLG
jgi:hypothetical protein